MILAVRSPAITRAIPRARLRPSGDAWAEANAVNEGLGGFNADGAEIRVKIDF
jgi:hypothetical protein